MEGAFLGSEGGEFGADGGIMGELAEDGGGPFFEKLLGGLDGSFYAETHAVVVCDEDGEAVCDNRFHYEGKYGDGDERVMNLR